MHWIELQSRKTVGNRLQYLATVASVSPSLRRPCTAYSPVAHRRNSDLGSNWIGRPCWQWIKTINLHDLLIVISNQIIEYDRMGSNVIECDLKQLTMTNLQRTPAEIDETGCWPRSQASAFGPVRFRGWVSEGRNRLIRNSQSFPMIPVWKSPD